MGTCRKTPNKAGRVILYADRITTSMKHALEETHNRREKQEQYNAAQGITPTNIQKKITHILSASESKNHRAKEVTASINLTGRLLRLHIKKLQKEMLSAAKDLDFETAAALRNQIRTLESQEIF